MEAIPVASDRVSAVGNQVIIDPVADLQADVAYYVTSDAYTVYDSADVDVVGAALFVEDFEGLELQDSKLVGSVGENVDHYVAVLKGTLDVQTAGVYTFGVNSDDGQRLAIDVAGNGVDIFDDEIIYDDTTHATSVRLSTCEFEAGLTSCVDNGDPGISLDVGQYEFEFWYFEATGSSSGEFFYGPGSLEAFSASDFALVGDDSLGIGVVGEEIELTIYKSALEDQTLDTIDSWARAEDLIDGVIPSDPDYPKTKMIPTADVWNSGGGGLYPDDHALPDIPEPPAEFDWSPDAPEGWTRESSVADLGAQPEFNGWTFLTKEFWIDQQGDQARSTFAKGDNVLAVSDPDAIDDFLDIGGGGTTEKGIYNGWLSTPEISLAGVEAEKISLSFDSSYRPYPTMVGKVEVSFDSGGNWDELLLLNDDTVEGGTSSLSRANATEVLEVNNPGEGTVMFRWVMEDAGNDWWWAIDNIRVNTPFSGNPLAPIEAGQWSFTATAGATLEGDIDGNGKVEFADFLRLSAAFGSDVAPGTPEDIDGSGTVDFADFLKLSANFGKSIGQIAADVAQALSAETFQPSEDTDDDDVEPLAVL